MINITKIRIYFLILIGFIFISVSVLKITACKSSIIDELENTSDGDTRLVVAMHDTPFKMDDKNIQELNITVEQIVIIDNKDKHFIILDEERQIELLSISRSDPVILSNVSVEPGTYKELRLVLKEDSTINVDGEVHPIKIPSGSQSGLKLKGPFEIPQGKLFRLIIDFVASESVHWNKGQGWMLKPVLRISSDAEIIGIFRGKFTFANTFGSCETLFQMYSDNTARLRISDYPSYTLYANYVYNSSRKEIRLTNIELSAPGLKKKYLNKVMKKLPNEIVLPVKQWSLDSIIAIDTNGLVCNLYRVDNFTFSDDLSYTEFTLHIDYPDGSKSDKDVVTEIQFIDTGMPPLTYITTLEGSRTTINVEVLNNYIQGSSTRIQVTSYLFDNPAGLNGDTGIYASHFVPIMMVDSIFSESTNNPWQKPSIFTLIREANSQEFTVSFPIHLNIKMKHDNFTNNNPVITWDHYPYANNGYLVLVFTEDKDQSSFDDGSEFFALAYHEYTRETQIKVFSNRITFTPTYSTIHKIPPSIDVGDIIIIEVYVLDGSSTLDTKTKQGAYLMESLVIKR